jgi:hypothetical protein
MSSSSSMGGGVGSFLTTLDGPASTFTSGCGGRATGAACSRGADTSGPGSSFTAFFFFFFFFSPFTPCSPLDAMDLNYNQLGTDVHSVEVESRAERGGMQNSPPWPSSPRVVSVQPFPPSCPERLGRALPAPRRLPVHPLPRALPECGLTMHSRAP